MKVHAQAPTVATWPLCGATNFTNVSNDPGKVTCGHCLRKLGHNPRRELDAAVDRLVVVADADPWRLMPAVEAVVKAWHAERAYRARNRYQR